MPQLERVPISRQIVAGELLVKNGPRKHVRPVETCQPHLPGGGVKSVMLVLSIGCPHQASSSIFVLKLDLYRQLERRLWHGARRETQ